jgi:hypothetical protein
VSYSGVTATLNPSSALTPNTLYTATITSGAEDLAGNALLLDYVWVFTTGAAQDTLRPTVSATVPANATLGVSIEGNLSATFSEAMDPLTINTTTFTLDGGLTTVAGTVSYSGVTATFNPSSALTANTLYTATITTGVKDLAGNALLLDYVWVFTTGATLDTTAPTVILTIPDDQAINVLLDSNIAVTFSEALDPVTINTVSFTVANGNVQVAGTVGYAGVIATFNPNSELAPNTTYTATVSMETTDLAGNTPAEDYVWTFTTGDTLDTGIPEVESTTPIDNAIGVPLNAVVRAVFTEAMNPLTISTATFTLDDGTTPINGSVNYVGDEATFTPNTNLVADTEYTAMILMEASDLAGNTLLEDYLWTFTTGATTAQLQLQLGTTSAFAILAGATVTNTGPSVITGDLGVSPGTAVVGFPPGTLNGEIFTGVGSAAGQAKADLNAAFNEAAGRSTGAVSLPGDLSGLTLYPGLYTNSTSVMLSTGNVTLDAQGDSNAVFLFQMGSTLTTGSSTQVILAGGAKATNIYWQVGTSATLGTNSSFKGNILAEASITMTTGATLDGRALTQNRRSNNGCGCHHEACRVNTEHRLRKTSGKAHLVWAFPYFIGWPGE